MVFTRKIAYVDLSKGEVSQRVIPKEIRRLYLGGRGINMYLLYNHLNPGVDPLSPDNVLLVGAGLLCGIPALGSGRCDIAGKSPLTGAIGDSNVGGFFASELRFAGFDHLLIKGKAKKPVYLWVHDGAIEIKDAKHLWGKDTVETQSIIRSDHGDPDVKCLVIGQAGENLVRFANVRTGIKNSAGRTGMGCLMGSKNLKAIAARGTLDVEFTQPDQLLDYCLEMNRAIMRTRWAQAQSRWGTMVIYSNTGNTGLVRVRNFQLNRLEKPELIEPELMEKYSIGMAACYSCAVHCRHKYVYTDPRLGAFYDEGPEYTSQGAWALEPDCPNFENILVGNHLVNRYGLDTLETGSLIAWAFELYEKGIITREMTGGLELKWGNFEAVVELIHMIVKRQGIGDILAEGPKRAIEKLGAESAYYCIQIKGMSNLHSDERPTPSFALGIATATRGSDHLRSRPAIDLYGLPEELLERIYGARVSSDYTSYEGKARMVWWQELMYAVVDSLGLCKFQTKFISVGAPCYEEWIPLIKYAVGMEFTKEQLMEIGERIYTVERLFNVREGFSRKDDYLPERYYVEPTPVGLPIARGKKIDRERFDQMLNEYYELHGWDLNGVPKPEALRRLGLDKEPSRMF